ncbi:MAG: hypothetical protein KAT00_07120 [Planctomycetes bacterium]|nr:hypothetical protein [Planctomycetota bacterium]
MGLSKHKRSSVCIAALAVVVVVFGGCSDDDDDRQSAKDLRRSTKEVLAASASGQDVDEARANLKSAIAKAGRSAGGIDGANMATGHLAIIQAQQTQRQQAAKVAQTGSVLNEIHLLIGKSGLLQTQRVEFESLLSATVTEVAELEKLISGNGDNPGLGHELEATNIQLQQLRGKRDRSTKEALRAQNSADELQRQADEFMRQSEFAADQEAQSLQRQGFELMQAKKKFFMQAQEAMDQAELLDSRIAIVEPLVGKLQADVQEVREQIKAIEQSPRSTELRTQIGQIDEQIKKCDSRIAWLTGDLNRIQGDYDKAVDAITQLMAEAADTYDKVRSRSLRTAARMRMADCYWQTATVFSSAVNSSGHAGLRLDSMAQASEDQTKQSLSKIAEAFHAKAADYGKKAMEQFNLAIDTYEQIDGRSGLKSESDKDLAKNHILALIGKMTLAEQIGQHDAADEARKKAEQLIEKAAEGDEAFLQTATARLFAGDTQYVPLMAVDNAIFFESIKAELEGWKRLPREEREAAVNILLEKVAELQASPSNDDDFNRMIQSQRQNMEDALAKGFEEEEEEIITDPNFL